MKKNFPFAIFHFFLIFINFPLSFAQIMIKNKAVVGATAKTVNLPAGFSPVTGSLSVISRNDNYIWGANNAGEIYKWTGQVWQIVTGPGTKIVDISIGGDGTVFCIDIQNGIWKLNNATNKWDKKSGAAKKVSVANNDNVWVVGVDKRPYRWNESKNNWDVMPGDDVIDISVASDGTIFCINASSSILKFIDNKWVQGSGSLKQLSVGGNNGPVVGINNNNELWLLKNPDIVNVGADGKLPMQFEKIGNASYVSVDKDGNSVLLVQKNGKAVGANDIYFGNLAKTISAKAPSTVAVPGVPVVVRPTMVSKSSAVRGVSAFAIPAAQTADATMTPVSAVKSVSIPRKTTTDVLEKFSEKDRKKVEKIMRTISSLTVEQAIEVSKLMEEKGEKDTSER